MNKKLLTVLIACLCGTNYMMGQTAASAIDGKKQTLFSSVNHASTPYRIPAVATLNNGTVLAVADQRPCGADVGNGEVDIYAKVGTIASDGTYTWNPATTDPSANGGLKIADGTGNNGYGDAAVVVDRESGKVLVICVAGNVVFSKGTSSKHNKMARIVGSADGLSWESPQDVTSKFFANELSSAYTMFMASGKMVQSQIVKVGDYYRIYGALLVRDGNNTNYKNYVVYTDDFGEKWTVLGGGYAVSNADEAKVEELPNGDIVLSSRTSGGRYYNVFKFSNLNNAAGSWGSATKCSFAGSNSTNGELLFYKGLVDANGKEYNVMLQSLPTGSSRSNVAVYYKAFATDKSSWSVSDFTSGWTKGIEVDNGASAYSTMTILPNGQVGFLYEDDYDTSKATGDYSNIVYVPLTVSELTNGAYTIAKDEPEPEPEQVATPVISPNGGSYESSVTVTISCATEGASIRYTLDGNTPTEASAEYTAPFALTESATIKVIAMKDGNYIVSDVASAVFTITQPTPDEGGEDNEEPDTPDLTTYEVTTVTGKLGNATYNMTTFSAPVATVVPSGVKAYYVKSANDETISLTRISSGKSIPAGEGVILASSSTTFNMVEATDESNVAICSGNLLVPTDAKSPIVPAGAYVLALKGSGELKGQLAFCLLSSDFEYKPNRAYLQLEAGASLVRMMFDGGETSVDDVLETTQDAVYYDLTGRRVANPVSGCVYIQNGKKVVK